MTLAPAPATLKALYSAFEADNRADHARLLASTLRSGRLGVISSIRGHVLGDDWMDFACTSLEAYWELQAGYVYVVTNPVTPEFIKVGKTRLAPEARLKSLNNEAVVGQFFCIQHWRVHDRHFLEAAAHRVLADIPRHKEFFACDWQALVPRVAEVIRADHALFFQLGLPCPEPTTYR